LRRRLLRGIESWEVGCVTRLTLFEALNEVLKQKNMH